MNQGTSPTPARQRAVQRLQVPADWAVLDVLLLGAAARDRVLSYHFISGVTDTPCKTTEAATVASVKPVAR
jgi:hypothetical protein